MEDAKPLNYTLNWYTKEKIEAKIKIELFIDDFVETIKKADKKCKDEAEFVENVYAFLEQRNELRAVPPDSRLPTSSLWSHLKLTSAIALCMAPADSRLNAEDYQKIRLCALLHDLGKVYIYEEKYRQEFETEGINKGKFHAEKTRDFLVAVSKKANMSKFKDLFEYAARNAPKHHRSKMYGELMPKEGELIPCLVADADTYASVGDRNYEVRIDAKIKGSEQYNEVTIKSDDAIFPHYISGNEYTIIKDENDKLFTDKNALLIAGKKEQKVKISINAGHKRSVSVFFDSLVNGGHIAYLEKDENYIYPDKKISLMLLDLSGIQGFISAVDKLPYLRGSSNMLRSLINRDALSLLQGETGLCPEQVIFSEGGNLLVLLLKMEDKRKEEIKKKLQEWVYEKTFGEIKAHIAIHDVILSTVRKEGSINCFGKILEDMHDAIDLEKTKAFPKKHEPVENRLRCEFCKCFSDNLTVNEEGKSQCRLCKAKTSAGQKNEWIERLGIDLKGRKPAPDTSHLGNNIAVIHMDGNMTSRVMKQSVTPADYSFKSRFLVEGLQEAVKSVIKEMLDEENSPLIFKYETKEYFGLDILYIGGDDILLIINADVALEFSRRLIEEVKRVFLFEGEGFSTPTVTLSAGVVFAKPSFPIYFLLDEARRLEGKAKDAFRKHIVTDKKYGNLLKLPHGCMAVNSVTSAMPTGKGFCILFDEQGKPYDKEVEEIKIPVLYEEDYNLFETFVSELNKTQEGEGRTRFYEVLLSGNTILDKMNAIKRVYASVAKTKKSEYIERAHMFARVLKNDNVLRALQQIAPMLGKGAQNE